VTRLWTWYTTRMGDRNGRSLGVGARGRGTKRGWQGTVFGGRGGTKTKKEKSIWKKKP